MLKKANSCFVIVISIFALVLNFVFPQGITIDLKKMDNQIYKNKSIFIGDESGLENMDGRNLGDSNDLLFRGPNFSTQYRIYMDRSGDRWLPEAEAEHNDYLVGIGSKNKWYEHLIPGLSIDITDYAKSKDDFLEKYKTITFDYFYSCNFWNAVNGWSYEFGKNTYLLTGVQTYYLTDYTSEKILFEDGQHSNKERARLRLRQEWNGNTLTFSFYLGVYYTWAWGSLIDHASFATFKNDEYIFTSVADSVSQETMQIDTIIADSHFTLLDYSHNIPLDNFEEKLTNKAKEKAISESPFKKVICTIQGYHGSIKNENITYVWSILARWYKYPTADSTRALNGISVKRNFITNYNHGIFELRYENLDGDNETSIYETLESYFVGIQLSGNFYSPFIYV